MSWSQYPPHRVTLWAPPRKQQQQQQQQEREDVLGTSINDHLIDRVEAWKARQKAKQWWHLTRTLNPRPCPRTAAAGDDDDSAEFDPDTPPQGWRTSKMLADAKLSLMHQNIKELVLPLALTPHFRMLTKLSLANNRLASLPHSIFYLSALEVLDVSYNRLESVPQSFPGYLVPNLANLRICYLQHNRLMDIPPQFGYLDHLVCLNISDNPVPWVPLELTSIKFLECLNTRFTPPVDGSATAATTPAPLTTSDDSSDGGVPLAGSAYPPSLVDLCIQPVITTLTALCNQTLMTMCYDPAAAAATLEALSENHISVRRLLALAVGHPRYHHRWHGLGVIDKWVEVSQRKWPLRRLLENAIWSLLLAVPLDDAADGDGRGPATRAGATVLLQDVMAFACARFGITREDSDEEACCPVWLDEVTKRLNQLDRCTICGTFMAAPVWNVVTRRPLYPVLTRCCSKRCRMQAAGVRNLGDLVPPSDSGNGNNNATSDDGEGGCTDQIILP